MSGDTSMRNYLIRVHLPDRPGALGAVASRIGSVGGDVVSFEILQRDGDVVVDEFGVRLQGDGPIELLRDEILEVDGVSVECLRPVEGGLPDRSADLLDAAADLFRQQSTDVLLERLADRVRAGLAADFAAVVEGDGSALIAGTGGLPGGERLEALARPDTDSRGVGTAIDPVATTARMGQAGMVLLVGRRDPVLRDSERQWVSIMADIADHGWRDLARRAG